MINHYSKKAARRYLASLKPGVTVREFLMYCNDMMTWFDDIQGTNLEACYRALKA
jgi:hypothetical protein